jgi:hypothetical protein
VGAWGPGSFENDDALDWIGELADAKDGWALVRMTLTVVAKADYAEAPESSAALASAEGVAIALGKPPSVTVPGELSTWVARHRSGCSEELRVLALRTVQRVRSDSELKDLWGDSENADWDDVVGDLERRLST